MEINNRLLEVTFGSAGGKAHTYDQNFNIRIRISKDILGVNNKATIDIINASEADRNFFLSGFHMWRARKFATPFLPIEVRIGRSRKNNMRRVFLGAVISASSTMPPDIISSLDCATSQNARVDLTAYGMPYKSPLKVLCQWCADQLQVKLVYAATGNPTSISPQRLMSIASLPAELNRMFSDKLAIHLDDGELIVRDINMAMEYPQIDVNRATGLVGMPTFYEFGVAFTTMADLPIRLGGSVKLESKMNPSVDGEYVVTSINYELETRSNNWYAYYKASPTG